MRKILITLLTLTLSLLLINQPVFKANALTADFATTNEATNPNFDETRYGGNGELTFSSRTISYATKKIVEEYQIPFGLPRYYGENDKSVCANVSGAIVIGYYDRFCENLIPDYKTYQKRLSIITYKNLNARILTLIDELKGFMQGNNPAGATFNEYKKGLNNYCLNAGYTYRDESVFASNKLSMQKYKSAIDDKKPVAVFLNSFKLLGITESADKITISEGQGDFTHIVTCYGYYKCEYYDKNGKKVYTADCLKVATGYKNEAYYFLSVADSTNIQNAISVAIE